MDQVVVVVVQAEVLLAVVQLKQVMAEQLDMELLVEQENIITKMAAAEVLVKVVQIPMPHKVLVLIVVVLLEKEVMG